MHIRRDPFWCDRRHEGLFVPCAPLDKWSLIAMFTVPGASVPEHEDKRQDLNFTKPKFYVGVGPLA